MCRIIPDCRVPVSSRQGNSWINLPLVSLGVINKERKGMERDWNQEQNKNREQEIAEKKNKKTVQWVIQLSVTFD